ncbi:MAG: hypothetical protein ACP5NN_10630 [Methanolinea sp.]
MNLLHDRRIPLILILLLFVIPLNIYVIGEWIGTGVQWALFRYQETSYGISLISLTRDFEYITYGVLTGKTAVSVALWGAGTILLIIAFLALAAMIAEEMNDKVHIPGLLVIASGILLLASCMTQYGPFFSGPAGISIPIGIPLVLAIGWLIYSRTWQGNEEEASDELNSNGD